MSWRGQRSAFSKREDRDCGGRMRPCLSANEVGTKEKKNRWNSLLFETCAVSHFTKLCPATSLQLHSLKIHPQVNGIIRCSVHRGTSSNEIDSSCFLALGRRSSGAILVSFLSLIAASLREQGWWSAGGHVFVCACVCVTEDLEWIFVRSVVRSVCFVFAGAAWAACSLLFRQPVVGVGPAAKERSCSLAPWKHLWRVYFGSSDGHILTTSESRRA